MICITHIFRKPECYHYLPARQAVQKCPLRRTLFDLAGKLLITSYVNYQRFLAIVGLLTGLRITVAAGHIFNHYRFIYRLIRLPDCAARRRQLIIVIWRGASRWSKANLPVRSPSLMIAILLCPARLPRLDLTFLLKEGGLDARRSLK